MMKLSNTAKIFAVCLCATLLLPALAIADDDDKKSKKSKKTHYPIDLEIISPLPPKSKKSGKPKKSKMIEFHSGWPLTFKLSTNDKHLLGTFVPGSGTGSANLYPEAGTRAWLIFDDTDDCLYLEGLALNGLTEPCSDQTGAGEVFLGFTADIDFPYLVDLDPGGDHGHLRSHGRPDLRAELAARYPDNGPEWGGPALSEQTVTVPGPITPGSDAGEALPGILDGVGYGPNDDLPGLVVISNTGVGIVYDPLEFEGNCDTMGGYEPCDFDRCDPDGVCENIKPPLGILQNWERAIPEARHNLSGLMGTVGYELNDQERQTTITTSLLVPRYLFTHLEARDQCYDSDSDCYRDDNLANRIDAGPVNYPGIDPSTSIVELRAFVINGTAPSTIEDCNGDGAVTSADVTCEGYKLISNEVVLEFVQIGGIIDHCNVDVDPWSTDMGVWVLGRNVKLVDLDGNLSGHNRSCPPGSGGVINWRHVISSLVRKPRCLRAV
ncbi:MAG: hypothetical protein GY732_12295 [Gammaproteobacteria bacterium]|nr:hypothetical protein [Gammaproteobacteria bacterium]